MGASELEPTSAADDGSPRRLSRKTVLVRALQQGPSIILAIPLVIVWSRGDSFLLLPLIAGAVLLGAVSLVAAWLHWRTFTYQILPGQLVIASGLFTRTRRTIPAERIQDVSITRSLLSRLFGLAEVRVETGAGEADEGKLDSVSLSEAHRLREVLRHIRSANPDAAARSAAAIAAATPPEAVLFRLSLPRLILYGLFNFSLVWVAVAFGALQYVGDAFNWDWDRWRELAGVAEREVRSRFTIGLVAGAAIAAVTLGFIAGVVRTTLTDYGFRLVDAEGRFRTTRGLLTQREVVVAKRQIQLGLVERGPFSGPLGWRSLQVQTLGDSAAASGRQVLAPFARVPEVRAIIEAAALPLFRPEGLRPVDGGHGVRGLIGFVLLPALLIAATAAAFPNAAWAALILILPLFVALNRTRRHRYGLAADSLQVARGVLTARDYVVPYGNIQTVTVQSGPLQRWLKLVTIRIDTAGGRQLTGPHIHDLGEAQAPGLVAELLERAEGLGADANTAVVADQD